ncbi:claudin-23 [Spea bombifrons]|uniref:claudin-23 n=1 Tax=Spea bombifrons TaxID=233779 RepID=UPI0023496971|nr:claudin-23 [Spea bombifrons]
MRTPVVMIIGMVLAPCGLVLNLTATVAPNWRQISGLILKPQDVVLNQGIWDICEETTTSQSKQCGKSNPAYFSHQVVQVARGLMIASLVVTALGIVLASLGVRCWEDEPVYLMAGLGGLVIFSSGILSLIPISWYTDVMYSLPGSSATETVSAGYSLVLGYLGSCLEIIGGFSLALSLVHSCKRCMENRGSPAKAAMYYSNKNTSAPKTNKSANPDTNVYSINNDTRFRDPYPTSLGYSVGNDNYRYGNGSKNNNSLASSPRSYTNSMDVTEGRRPRSHGRPTSQLSSLPCDSDLL